MGFKGQKKAHGSGRNMTMTEQNFSVHRATRFFRCRAVAAMVRVPCPRTDTPLGLPRRHGRGRRAAGAAGAAARQEPHQDPVLPGGLRHWRILLLLDAALLQPSSKQHRHPRRFILLFVVGVVPTVVLLPQVLRVLLASPAASPAHLHPEVCILASPFSWSQSLRRRPRL